METYEYKVVSFESERDAAEEINKLAIEGFRVIAVAGTRYYIYWTLERKVQPATPYRG